MTLEDARDVDQLRNQELYLMTHLHVFTTKVRYSTHILADAAPNLPVISQSLFTLHKRLYPRSMSTKTTQQH